MKSMWDILFVLLFILILFLPMLIILLYSNIEVEIIKLFKRPKFKVNQNVKIYGREGIIFNRNFKRFEEYSVDEKIKVNEWMYSVEYEKDNHKITKNFVGENELEESTYSIRNKSLKKLLK